MFTFCEIAAAWPPSHLLDALHQAFTVCKYWQWYGEVAAAPGACIMGQHNRDCWVFEAVVRLLARPAGLRVGDWCEAKQGGRALEGVACRVQSHAHATGSNCRWCDRVTSLKLGQTTLSAHPSPHTWKIAGLQSRVSHWQCKPMRSPAAATTFGVLQENGGWGPALPGFGASGDGLAYADPAAAKACSPRGRGGLGGIPWCARPAMYTAGELGLACSTQPCAILKDALPTPAARRASRGSPVKQRPWHQPSTQPAYCAGRKAHLTTAKGAGSQERQNALLPSPPATGSDLHNHAIYYRQGHRGRHLPIGHPQSCGCQAVIAGFILSPE